MTTATPPRKKLVTEGNDPDSRYHVPRGSGEFWAAPDVEKIANRLIAEKLPDFPACSVGYLWKGRGGQSGGNPTLGKCVMPAGLTLYFAEFDYIIWLAADNVEDHELSHYQVEALIFHELLHVFEDEDEKGNKSLTVKGHDFEGFRQEIADYGFWKGDIKAIARTIQGRLELGEDPRPEVEAAEIVLRRGRRAKTPLEAALASVNGHEPEDLPNL